MTIFEISFETIVLRKNGPLQKNFLIEADAISGLALVNKRIRRVFPTADYDQRGPIKSSDSRKTFFIVESQPGSIGVRARAAL